MTKLVAAAALLTLVGACGGGGGGNDDQLHLNFATPDTTQAFSSLGQNVIATTDEDGNLIEIRVGDNSFSGEAISDNNADTGRADIAEMLRTVAAGEIAQDFVLDNQTLDNAAFGIVADGQLVADAFAFGLPTPSQNVPITGEATYSGRTIGTGSDDGVTQFAFTGDVRIHANFATGAVSANLTDFETRAVETGAAVPGIPDLRGSGFLTEGDYTVGLASEDGGIPDWLGSADGRLFGPGADETAGIWSAQNAGENIIVEGAFGASR
jgi:hypothetical protein